TYGSAAYGGASYYPLFKGFVERWESKWSPEHRQTYAEIDVSAVDGFESLSLTAVTGSVPAGLSGATVGSLLSRANSPADSRVLDAGVFQVAAVTTDPSTGILNYIQTVAVGEGGLFFFDAAGNAVFHDRNHRTTNTRSTVSQGTFSDVPDGGLPYT